MRCALLALLTSLLGAAAQDPPGLSWQPGELFLRVDGRPQVVLGRNPAARQTAEWVAHFDAMAAAGERLARIHLCWMPAGEVPGEISPAMLAGWDALLTAAAERGLVVLPVLGVWSAWNDGRAGEVWHGWEQNPFNATRGGPAQSPDELFVADSRCQQLWLQRLRRLVERWAPRRCIVGWEIFSELDLLTGSSEDRATRFATTAAAVIRAADPLHRPITASLTSAHEWPALQRSAALDWLQVHPYGHGAAADLDQLLLTAVRQRLAAYGKPVLLGECGLDWAPPRGTLDAAPEAASGLRHAVWAALVSGAATARMFWWQDGSDAFEQADLARHCQTLAAPAARWAARVDWRELRPQELPHSVGLWGAALGDPRGQRLLAWYRDARCRAPRWPLAACADQWIDLPATGDWELTWIDPVDGRATTTRQRGDHPARRALPPFTGSLALWATRRD